MLYSLSKIIELLTLREQEIAIKNAVETAISADEQASTKIAATVFTVVTFIYVIPIPSDIRSNMFTNMKSKLDAF